MKRASLVSNLDTCRALTEYRNASRASQTLNRRVTRGINLIMIARSDERGADNLPKAATRTSRDAAVSECSTRSTRRQYARAQRVRCARTEGEGPLGSNPQASAGASEANEPSSPSLSRPDAPAAVAVASAESGPDQAGVGAMDYDSYRPDSCSRLGGYAYRVLGHDAATYYQYAIYVRVPAGIHPGRVAHESGGTVLTVGAIATRQARHAAPPRRGVSARSDHPRAVRDTPPVSCASTAIPANPGRPVDRSRIPSPRGIRGSTRGRRRSAYGSAGRRHHGGASFDETLFSPSLRRD